MALTKSSALFYWDALYGLQPIVGGDPEFNRDSAAWFRDRAGFGRKGIVDVPRLESLKLEGMTRRALLLERAGTNLQPHSEDFSAWGIVYGTPTRTGGQPDPLGGQDAYLIEDDDAGGTERISENLSGLSGDGTKAMSVYMKAGTSGASFWRWQDVSAGVTRRSIRVDWADGVPTLVAEIGGGTLFEPEPLADGWYRLAVTVQNVVAANVNRVELGPSGQSAAATGTTYFFGSQAENGTFPSSYIRTSGAVASRTADQFHWQAPAYQAAAIYIRSAAVDAGSLDSRVIQWGMATDANPRVLIYTPGTGTFIMHSQPSASVGTSNIALALTPEDDVEFMGLLFADGSCRLSARKNGGAVVSGGTSAAPGLSLTRPTHFWLNSMGATKVGAGKFAAVKLAKFGDLDSATDENRMDELAAYELGPTGDLLSA